MTNRNATQFVHEIGHSVVVPGSRVVRSMEVAQVGGRHAEHNNGPAIELVTEDNVVRAIDITCACGQKMRLWCSYETEASS